MSREYHHKSYREETTRPGGLHTQKLGTLGLCSDAVGRATSKTAKERRTLTERTGNRDAAGSLFFYEEVRGGRQTRRECRQLPLMRTRQSKNA